MCPQCNIHVTLPFRSCPVYGLDSSCPLPSLLAVFVSWLHCLSLKLRRGVLGTCFRAPPTHPARVLRSDSTGVGVVLLVLEPALPRITLAKPYTIKSKYPRPLPCCSWLAPTLGLYLAPTLRFHVPTLRRTHTTIYDLRRRCLTPLNCFFAPAPLPTLMPHAACSTWSLVPTEFQNHAHAYLGFLIFDTLVPFGARSGGHSVVSRRPYGGSERPTRGLRWQARRHLYGVGRGRAARNAVQ